MKRSVSSLFVLILSALVLLSAVSCSFGGIVFEPEEPEKGYLRLYIVEGRTAVPSSLDHVEYQLTIRNNLDEVILTDAFPQDSNVYECTLPQGFYSVSVIGVNEDNVEIYCGDTSVYINADSYCSASVYLNVSEGYGYLSCYFFLDMEKNYSVLIRDASGNTYGDVTLFGGVSSFYVGTETLPSGVYILELSELDSREFTYLTTCLILNNTGTTWAGMLTDEGIRFRECSFEPLSLEFPELLFSGESLKAEADVPEDAVVTWLIEGEEVVSEGSKELDYIPENLGDGTHLIICIAHWDGGIGVGLGEFYYKETKEEPVKVGFVVAADESDPGYRNYMDGMTAAIQQLRGEGYDVELITKKNTTESFLAYDNNVELAEEGCTVIFNTSYGFENFALPVAKDYPDTEFVFMGNYGAQLDGRANTHNAYAAVYEGRYLAGVVAGLKLQEEIDEGKISPKEAVLGYVGAFSFAEVISDMSGFYLGAKSVCPSVTMKVHFTGTWGDYIIEEAASIALVDRGCKVLTQYSGYGASAQVAQREGIYHVGNTFDTTKIAPEVSLISTGVDWSRYFYSFIKNVCDGVENPSDYTGTYADGDIKIVSLNKNLVSFRSRRILEEVRQELADGALEVFDTSTFTVNGGQTLEHAYAVDTNGDYTPDSCEAVWDGVFHESYSSFQSAPYFAEFIDGIEWLNAAF